MTDKEKNLLIKHIDKLYREERHEDIAELLVSMKDVKEDYDLSCLLARTFIDLGDDVNTQFFEAAEILLSKFITEGFSDPKWHYLMARALYFQGRTIESVRHLEKIFKLGEDESYEKFPDAAEMLDTCKGALRSEIKLYDPEQLKALKDHIDAYFGSISRILSEDDPLGVNVDIAVIEPDEFHNYYTLVTIGMGANRMDVPESFAEERLERAELIIYLPSDWDPDSTELKDRWAVEQMRSIARLPLERNTWMGYGHMVSNGMPLADNTKLCATMLISVQDVADESLRCFLPDGEDVVFYQLFPIYKEEMDYKIAHGIKALIKKMPHISAVYDPDRENVCENYDKEHDAPLLLDEIDMLEDIKIGELCAASRRIIEDGCRIGFMKRILFDSENDLSANDSGWLLLAGDESQEYLADPYHIELCRLNTVCNIDSDIVPFLDSPYGTEIARGYDGKLFILDSHSQPDEGKPVRYPS